MTLYRRGKWKGTGAILMWVVPVEPDYDKATSAARDTASWADEEIADGRMDAYEWWQQLSRSAVDAAYEIGGDDGER